VVGEVLDGNTSDHEWARGLLCRLSSTFKEDVIYVLQLFERMKVIRYENGRRRIPDNVRVPERVLSYLGLPVDIYLRHLPP